MPSKLPRYPLRIEQEYLDKLGKIAEKNERSINQELTYIIKRHIENYEKEHGKVKTNTELLTSKIG